MVLGAIYILVIAAFFLKKRTKNILFIFIFLILISYTTLTIVRPYLQNKTYDKYTQLVEEYLENKYPGASWDIKVNKKKLSAKFGYEIKVIFDDEPTTTYVYTVENNEVVQVAVSFEKDEFQNGRYIELE